MKTNSDTLYKQLFAHPEIVRDLLAGFLKADWARALEVDAFERVNASYVSDSGKSRHGDVVWRARIGGEWVYVYILLEFQTRPDRWMALRMQVYVGLLYRIWWRSAASASTASCRRYCLSCCTGGADLGMPPKRWRS